MIQAKCIQKFRNKQGRIYGYRVQDSHGNIRDLKSDELKLAIKSNQIEIINLKLTSDGRLIDIDNKTQPRDDKKYLENTKNKPVRNKNIILVDKHQPLLHFEIIKKLPECDKLNFMVVSSLDNFLAKAKIIGADVIRPTYDICITVLKNQSTVTIVSEVPVRILEDSDNLRLSKFTEIDFKNADLSYIQSLNNVIDTSRVIDTQHTDFDLAKLKKINSSLISKYKYSNNIVDLLNDKRADSYLDIAYTMFSIINWTEAGTHPGSGEFDWIIEMLVSEVVDCVGLHNVSNYEIRDLLLDNWSCKKESDDGMNYYHDLAAWAISRMIASNKFMQYLNKIMSCYDSERLIYLSLNQENLKRAIDSNVICMEEVLDYINSYGHTNFLKDLNSIIKCFRKTKDINALNFFKKSYDCLSSIIDKINKDRDKTVDKLKVDIHNLNEIIKNTFNTSIIKHKQSYEDGCIQYEAVTDKIATVDKATKLIINGSTGVYQAVIGASIRIFISLEVSTDGEYSEYNTEMKIVTDKIVGNTESNCSNKDDALITNYSSSGICTELDMYAVEESISTLKNEYEDFVMKTNNVRARLAETENVLNNIVDSLSHKYGYTHILNDGYHKLIKDNLGITRRSDNCDIFSMFEDKKNDIEIGIDMFVNSSSELIIKLLINGFILEYWYKSHRGNLFIININDAQNNIDKILTELDMVTKEI